MQSAGSCGRSRVKVTCMSRECKLFIVIVVVVVVVIILRLIYRSIRGIGSRHYRRSSRHGETEAKRSRSGGPHVSGSQMIQIRQLGECRSKYMSLHHQNKKVRRPRLCVQDIVIS